MFLSAFRKDPGGSAGEALHAAAVAQARRSEFYLPGGVSDSLEGRFELLAIHVWLILARLRTDRGARRTSQALVDRFFSGLDDALRESGVGDLSVGKKVRGMAEAFYGRARAYDAALAAGDPLEALAKAIARNVFSSPEAETGAALARYVHRAAAALASTPDARLRAGEAEFPEPASGGRE